LTGTTVNTNSANNTYNGSTYVGGNGGGIYNTGTATLTGSTVSNNTLTRVNDNNNSSDVNGGGIYNTGTVTLTGSTISTNTANDNNPGNGHANGGGVYNEGVLTLTNNSVINSNSAGLGGGIYNLGELTLTGGTVSNNTSFSTDGGGPFGIFGGGGGIFNGGSTAIADSKISGNSAIIGGGIANSAVNAPQRSGAAAQLVPGTLVLTNTAVTANTALFFGGGIFNSQGNLSITGGALSNNTASGFPFLGFGGQGGALLNLDTATLMNTTISNNSASNFGGNSVVMSGPFSNGNGGGIGNAGVLNVSGTTFSGNSVAGSGSGGALFNGPNFFRGMAGKAGLKPGARAASVDTVATLSNSTLSGNVTTNGGAAILNDDNSTVNLTNVTIANNASGILKSDRRYQHEWCDRCPELGRRRQQRLQLLRHDREWRLQHRQRGDLRLRHDRRQRVEHRPAARLIGAQHSWHHANPRPGGDQSGDRQGEQRDLRRSPGQ